MHEYGSIEAINGASSFKWALTQQIDSVLSSWFDLLLLRVSKVLQNNELRTLQKMVSYKTIYQLKTKFFTVHSMHGFWYVLLFLLLPHFLLWKCIADSYCTLKNRLRHVRIRNKDFNSIFSVRNSDQKCSVGKRVLSCRPGACNFIKKETLAQMFSCEFCEISKNTFPYRTPTIAASEKIYIILHPLHNSVHIHLDITQYVHLQWEHHQVWTQIPHHNRV